MLCPVNLGRLKLPINLVGAGLPQIVGQAGRAKSYAERLFEYPQLGPLDKKSARRALVRPAAKKDVAFEEDALEQILNETEGYPYFIQEWGKHCWKIAKKSPITLGDVNIASSLALTELDNSFFSGTLRPLYSA